ncbi:uncharacterized protein LOC123270265 [Cotesia glomerata]|uniref:uncharacterized protein LOC123270265 n=1 Tax=Cotesia glomerata TaxID=32391 RepID=UPI001D011DF2|nr:uncharacterized protein LOC123270265 [Cotesia glomerata]
MEYIISASYHTLDLQKIRSILHLLGSFSVKLKDIDQRLSADNRPSSYSSENKTLSKVKKALPLKNKDDVTQFETDLEKVTDFRREFVKIVSQVGGANGKEFSERLLNVLFSPSFAQHNTWDGKKNKYKVADLIVVKICEEVVLAKFTSYDSAEFSKTCNNWFRLGNQRAKQQPAQVQKQNQQVNNDQSSKNNN